MIVILKQNAEQNEVNALLKQLEDMGFDHHYSKGENSAIVGIIGTASPTGEAYTHTKEQKTMSTIYEIPCVKGFIRMCNDGWLQGWHERNGGNLTYRMTAEEVAACRPYFDAEPREWVNMGVQADNLAGEYFITTGSGKFFRNVEPDPIHSMW